MGIRRTFLFLAVLLLAQLAAFAADAPLRPGEVVRLVCVEEPTLNRDYTITRDGLLLVGFVGAVPVAGSTPDEAAARIAAALVDQRILTQATVTLKRVVPVTAPVRFRGAVRTSGELPWREGLRLTDVLRVAEPTVNADLARIEIDSADGRRLTAKSEDNPPLRPGDQIHVPPFAGPRELYVLGGVARPGSAAHTDGMTLGQALTAVGGVGPAGDPARIRLERTGEAPRRLAIPADADFPLLPQDRVVVELKAVQATFQLMGDVRRPGAFPHRAGITLTRAIAAAGGIPPHRKPTRAIIYRLGARDGRPIVIDLDRVLRGLQGDVPLEAGDRVLIADRVPRLTQSAGSGRFALR